MSQSIGQKLAAARKRRDFTIEDVAHETRIQPDTLRHLEADDYSSFPTLTYAKSFLSMYGRHLGLDVSDYLKQFGPANGSHTGRDRSSNGHRESDSLVPVIEPPKARPVLLLLAILVLVGAVPGMYILGRMHGFQSAKRFTVDPSSRTAMAPPAKPASPDTRDSKAGPAKPGDSVSAPNSPAPAKVASRQAEVVEDAPISMPDSGPVLPATPIVLPPPPADGEEVEVRRPAIFTEDDAETPPAPDAAPAPTSASTRPEVRTVPRALPFRESTN